MVQNTQKLRLDACANAIFQGTVLSRYRAEEANGRNYRIVNASDLNNLYLDSNLSEEVLNFGSYPENSLREHDVVIATRGNELKASVITRDYAGTLAGANLAVFRPILNARGQFLMVDPLFLAALFRSDWMKNKMSGLYMQSSAVQLVTLQQLRELELNIPPLEVQRAIAQLFLSFERYTHSVNETTQSWQQLIEAALQQNLGESHG